MVSYAPVVFAAPSGYACVCPAVAPVVKKAVPVPAPVAVVKKAVPAPAPAPVVPVVKKAVSPAPAPAPVAAAVASAQVSEGEKGGAGRGGAGKVAVRPRGTEGSPSHRRLHGAGCRDRRRRSPRARPCRCYRRRCAGD